MDLARFRDSLSRDAPPDGISGPLEALWREAAGDWEAAHRIVQEGAGAGDAWVHAYLHRREGDLPNAEYWYRRAGQAVPTGSPAEEWEHIVVALLDRSG